MSLPENKRILLSKFVNGYCEECHQHEDQVGKLQAHRIKRGVDGGVYQLRNIKMCCSHCHKLYHGKEFT